MVSDGFKHILEHGRGQAAGIGVVARAMKAIDKGHGVSHRTCSPVYGCDRVNRAMAERVSRFAQLQRGEDLVVCNAPECNKHAQVWELGQAAFEKRPAGLNFRRCRLVLWRHTADRICDHAVYQLQSVLGCCAVRADGKAGFQERCIEQIAGVIAGKGASGFVGTLQPRGQADNQQPRGLGTKTWNGGVEPVRFDRRMFAAEIKQPGT